MRQTPTTAACRDGGRQGQHAVRPALRLGEQVPRRRHAASRLGRRSSRPAAFGLSGRRRRGAPGPCCRRRRRHGHAEPRRVVRSERDRDGARRTSWRRGRPGRRQGRPEAEWRWSLADAVPHREPRPFRLLAAHAVRRAEPERHTMNDGIPFGANAGSMLDGLSPDLIARLLQAQQPQQAAPSAIDSLLFDRPGWACQTTASRACPGRSSARSRPRSHSPPGPGPAADRRHPAAAPALTAAAPEAPAGPARRRPRDRPSCRRSAPACSLSTASTPLTGQPVSGSPKPVAAPGGSAASAPGGDHPSCAAGRRSRTAASATRCSRCRGPAIRPRRRGLVAGDAENALREPVPGQGRSGAGKAGEGAGRAHGQRTDPEARLPELVGFRTGRDGDEQRERDDRAPDPARSDPRPAEDAGADAGRGTCNRSRFDGGRRQATRPDQGRGAGADRGSAAGSKDDVQIITRPDGSIVG